MGNCANCNTPLHGDYCYQCGEKKLDPKQRSLSYLFGQLAEELTSVDGRLFTSLKSFLVKPGQQCLDFHLGIRKKYISLFSLFFIFNLIYFLYSPVTDFNLSLREQRGQPYASLINPLIENYISESRITYEKLIDKYALVSATVAKSIIIVSVPFFAMLVWLINFNRSRYLQDHVIFALHIYCFIMLWPVMLKLFFAGLAWFMPDLPARQLYFNVLPVGILAFLWFSQKNTYQSNWLVTSLLLPPLLIALLISHFVYRFIQFWLSWIQIV